MSKSMLQSSGLSAGPAPRIRPLPASGPRPFWSVMIPACNPRPAQLAQALRSVLAQDPGPDRMQIEVVDDCSSAVDVDSLVRDIAGDRVGVFRPPANLGMAGCWSACVERARGEWVHLLHQDDYVLPEFYARLARGIQTRPDLGAAFCRHAFVAHDNHWVELSPLERRKAGVLSDFPRRVAQGCVLQCPSIVVRRGAYEVVGGYNPDFTFAVDWEMWQRIAAKFPVWYEPAILACYRTQDGTETGRNVETGRNLHEISILLDRGAALLEKPERRSIIARARTINALKAVRTAEMFLYRTDGRTERKFKAAWKQMTGALAMSPSPAVVLAIGGVGWHLSAAIIRGLFHPRRSKPGT